MGRPVLDLRRHGSRQIHRLVLGFRRQRNDQVEAGVFQLIKTARLVFLKINAELFHDRDHKRVQFARAHANRVHEYMPAIEMAHDSFRHGRANGILSAGEQYGVRQVFSVGPTHGGLALHVQDADEREQSPGRVVVDGDLAVEPLGQQRGALIVEAPAAHIDRLDL